MAKARQSGTVVARAPCHSGSCSRRPRPKGEVVDPFSTCEAVASLERSHNRLSAIVRPLRKLLVFRWQQGSER